MGLTPEKVCEICKRLHQQGFLAAADGNVSYRIGERVFITPSGVAKSRVQPDELAELELSGEIIAGVPSSEKSMHLTIYTHCDQAAAVVHAHPLHAIALSIARPDMSWLPEGAMSELVLAVGSVPLVPYACPGSEQMGTNLIPFLPDCRAMILSRHGVLCWGESLEEACQGVERIEHAARVLCLAIQMGGVTELPEEEIATLRQLRIALGERIL